MKAEKRKSEMSKEEFLESLRFPLDDLKSFPLWKG